MRTCLLTVITAACVVACGQDRTGGVDAPSPARQERPALTRAYARDRAGQVSDVRYQLDIDLDPAADHFSGENRLLFDWHENPADLTVDFGGGQVNAVKVNGIDVAVDYNDLFITVPAAQLLDGRNEIRIRFRHPWSDDGAGLYHYDDPDDGSTYLYTDFQPYDANDAFPLFDQPDIKGRFTLAVTAPEDWVVIGAYREVSVDAAGDGTQRWLFPETPLIPAYIMSVHAGPWAMWEDAGFRIPLRLFARRSMTEHVDPDVDMWFSATRAGFEYFEDYYGIDYPYAKYDQLLVPDFNAGAMENAGAVTFTERSYIQRDEWSHKERRRLVTVILHEMAHMWFGNLVTTKWWNDLWLNETFATFMAYDAAEQLGFDEAWQGFYLDKKYLAYWLDQRVTTHPIEVDVPDTYAARTVFDSISYAKGASVLRQIEFRLGKDVFQRGVQRYLERHALGNAELDDFVAALSAAADSDLSDWAQEWLATAGVNTIEAHFACEDGKVSEFELVQTAPEEHPELRTQKVQVSLLRDDDGAVTTDAVIAITYSGARTAVPDAVGTACPDLVYPNHGDYGYLLVKLDPRTRANLKSMIGGVEDDFQRVMYWQTLWDNVRFAHIPVTEYLDTVFAGAAREDDINNVDQVYAFVATAIQYLRQMQDAGAEALAEYRPQAEAVTWANVERTRGDLQTMYLDRYLAFASSDEAQRKLVALLDGDASLPGRELDQDRRWKMLLILSSEGHPRTAELLAREKRRDPSDDGRRWALAIEAARPDPDVKDTLIADIIDSDSPKSYAMRRITMRNLFRPGQEALHEAFAEVILEQILEAERNPDPEDYSRDVGFAAYLLPTICTPVSVARLESAIEQHRESRKAIRDYVLERHEDDALCVERARLLTSQ